MKTKRITMLILTALIWGIAFVAQSDGMNYIQPFTFNAVRFLLGGLVLIPCLLLLNKLQTGDRVHLTEEEQEKKRCQTIRGGICCGLLLGIASSFQQFGVAQTTVGKAGFITALYIIMVPLLGIAFHKRASWNLWVSVLLAILGMYLLCMNQGQSVDQGDLLVFCCAIVFSFHILVIDYYSPKADGVMMSCIQFFTAGVFCLVPALLWEKPELRQILAAWLPVLYAGVMSCGVAYTLQILGQKGLDPTVACLLLSLESVFSLLAGWVLLGQAMGRRELTGCGFVFIAIILAQIPEAWWRRLLIRNGN